MGSARGVLVVAVAKDGVASEKQRRFSAESVQNTGHFHGNVTRTDNRNTLGLRS
jgi:hypothetical protein